VKIEPSLRVEVLEERIVQGRRLGRHVEHDLRSRRADNALATLAPAAVARSVGELAPPIVWERHAPIWDQGERSACTGYAIAGCLMSGRHHPMHPLDAHDATDLYARATHLDHIRGVWPPTDTASTGLAAAKAARSARHIDRYAHAFGVAQTLTAIAHVGPVIVGVPWLSGFDQPIVRDADRLAVLPELPDAGDLRGGHEFVVRGFELDSHAPDGGWFLADNSWGADWGDKGSFRLSFALLRALLALRGDVVVPIPRAA